MPAQSIRTVVCSSCGRKYAWKQALAGRSVKCTCGARLDVPLEDVEPSGGGDGAYDLAESDDGAVTPPAYRAARPAAAAVLPRAAAPKRIPGSRGGARYDDDAARRHEIRKMVTVGGGLVVLIGLILGGRAVVRALSGPDTSNLPGLDGRVARLIKDDGGHEALAWLKENSRRGVVGFFWTREKTEARIQDWYAHGARNVLAFGGVMTSSLAIELPDDKQQRKYFFDVADQVFQERLGGFGGPGGAGGTGSSGQTDVNQKYVVIDFL
jgi:hypothetical protein